MPPPPGLKQTPPGQRWTLNKNGVTPNWAHQDPTFKVAQDHLNEFMDNIRIYGCSPEIAASSWDSNYKKLKGTTDQYEIRLTGSERATFRVNTATRVVTMLAVGGHT